MLRGLTWVGLRECIHINEMAIKEPLAFFTDSRSGVLCEEPAAVDLALPIAKQAYSPTARELPYWPSYAGLTSGQRRNYLQWLAGGRKTTPPELGYTFLYIYGLERRSLVQQVDQKIVFDEILRLRELYGASGLPRSGSFDSYTTSFLWFLAIRHAQVIALKRIKRLADGTSQWTDEALSTLLAWFAATHTPLVDWAAYLVAGGLPQSQRSVVVQRVNEQFRKLFSRKYAERFGTGMEVKVPKRERWYAYKPASAAIKSMEVNAPHPHGLPSQFKPLAAIWNDCVQELKKFSTAVARAGQGTVTVQAWEAMPAALRASVDHPLTEAFCALIDKAADESGHAIVTAGELASTAGLAVTDRLTPTQSRRLCETAGNIGYCLEPDARLTSKGYEAEQSLVVFLRTTEFQADATRYNAAACMLQVGLMMAAADGSIEEQEVSVLMQQIRDTFDLNDEEHRRLDALRLLLVAKGGFETSVRRLAKNLSVQHREALAKLALAVLAADGVVTDAEIRAARSCYAALGFARSDADRALAAFTVGPSDEPVTVQKADASAQSGEAIPAPPGEPPAGARLKLNRSAILAIMKDTQEVARLLAEAMQIEETKPAPVPPPVPAQVPPVAPMSEAVPVTGILETLAAPTVVLTTDTTLPQRYAAFYQMLISKPEWSLKDVEALARQYGHMLGGALEALNDWAFEKYGTQLLVEEGDRLVVEQQLLN